MGERRRRKPLVALATPIGSSCSTEYTRSLVLCFAQPHEFPDFALARLDCVGSLIPHNRNILCADAIEMGCSALVEVDSDMVWTPEDVRALVAPILRGRAEIVAAPCSPRVIDWDYLREAAARGEQDLSRHIGPAHMELLPEDADAKRLRGFKLGSHTYVRMARMGLGMTAVGRETLLRCAQVAPKYGPSTMTSGRVLADLHPQGVVEGQYDSEDIGFFRFVAPTPVYACVTADVGHESAGNVFKQDWFNGMLKKGWAFELEG
jgi:hypothetical protein